MPERLVIALLHPKERLEQREGAAIKADTFPVRCQRRIPTFEPLKKPLAIAAEQSGEIISRVAQRGAPEIDDASDGLLGRVKQDIAHAKITVLEDRPIVEMALIAQEALKMLRHLLARIGPHMREA